MEVTVCLVDSLLPNKINIQFRRELWQTLGKGGHILGQVDDMSTVPILPLRESLDRHDWHNWEDKHLLHLCNPL